jgi:hypothetical protein
MILLRLVVLFDSVDISFRDLSMGHRLGSLSYILTLFHMNYALLRFDPCTKKGYPTK